ncbi:MAG: M23 family metallopeptidase, partial [Sphingomonadaceae bacterium]|nr:M23 family metallopeptidase [Sphingomonadaceae bacterium]
PPQAVAALPPPPAFNGRFIAPVDGRLISRFGAKSGGLYNDGINLRAPAGAPIRAAANGVVVYAGNAIEGFGNLVLLKHDGGWVTAYAHAEDLLVIRGDTVRQGDPIARVGKTGSVDEPQLHFEIRQGKKPVDPLPHLPGVG